MLCVYIQMRLYANPKRTMSSTRFCPMTKPRHIDLLNVHSVFAERPFEAAMLPILLYARTPAYGFIMLVQILNIVMYLCAISIQFANSTQQLLKYFKYKKIFIPVHIYKFVLTVIRAVKKIYPYLHAKKNKNNKMSHSIFELFKMHFISEFYPANHMQISAERMYLRDSQTVY